MTKSFDDRPVEVVGQRRATTVPRTVTIQVTGTAEDLGQLAAESLVARVEPKLPDAELAKPGSAYLDVLVDVPHRGTGPVPEVRIAPARVVVKW